MSQLLSSLFLLLTSCASVFQGPRTQTPQPPIVQPYVPLDRGGATFEDLEKLVYRTYSEHQNINFFHSDYLSSAMVKLNPGVSFEPFLGLEGGSASKKPVHFFEIAYRGEGWIFWKRASLLCRGPKRWQEFINARENELSREVVRGALVSETYRSKGSLNLVKKIGNCDDLSIQLSGDNKSYQADFLKGTDEGNRFFDSIFVLNFVFEDLKGQKRLLKKEAF